MKGKRFLVAGAAVVLVGSVLSGIVLAQGGATSSTQTGVAPTSGGSLIQEGPPGSVLGSSDGMSSSESGVAEPAGVFLPEEEPGPGQINDGSINYNTSLRFTGAAFVPRENDVDYTVSPSGGCAYVTAGDNWTVWNIAVTLPQGARVEWLRLYANDTSTADTRLWFSKYDLYGGLDTEWLATSSGDSGTGYWDVQIDPTEVIDYDSYSYLLNWRPMDTGTSLQLCGARLFYYYSPITQNFLPTSQRESTP